jgi:SNF family Na+-dependent transporter
LANRILVVPAGEGKHRFFSAWTLPLGRLHASPFSRAWAVAKRAMWQQVQGDCMGKVLFTFWRTCARFVAPAAIVLVVLHSLGVL